MGKKSKALLDANSIMQFKPLLAVATSLNVAIVTQQLHYWLEHNEKDGKHETHYFDDRWWAYNSYEEWRKDNFAWWSSRTVQRAFEEGVELGIIISKGRYNDNTGQQLGNWYSIDYDKLNSLLDSVQPEGARQNGMGGLDKMATSPLVNLSRGGLDKMANLTENTKTENTRAETNPDIPPNPPLAGGVADESVGELSQKELVLKAAGINPKSWKYGALWTVEEIMYLLALSTPKGWGSRQAWLVETLKDPTAKAAIQTDIDRAAGVRAELDYLASLEKSFSQTPPPTPSPNCDPLLLWDKVANHMKFREMKPGDFELYLESAQVEAEGNVIRVGVTAHQAHEINKRFKDKLDRRMLLESNAQWTVEIVEVV